MATVMTNLDELVTKYLQDDAFQQERERISSKRLADLVIKTRLADLVNVDLVRLLEDLDLVASDRTKNADCKTRAGEGVALYEMVRDGKKAPKGAYFIYSNNEYMHSIPRERRAYP